MGNEAIFAVSLEFVETSLKKVGATKIVLL